MEIKTRRDFLKTLGVGAVAASLPSWIYSCATGKRKPNILFIMSDDHAAHAISCYGSKINATPQLDRLASEGMRFDNCFCTNGICAPSRASILTGKYNHLNGMLDNKLEFDGKQQTLPKLLKPAGYQTAMIGKWHLKSEPTGFDYYKVLPGQGKYFDPLFQINGNWPETTEEKGYVTDIITDEAIQFMRNADSEKPFLLMCHHKAPHRPWQPDPKHWAQFKDREIPEPPTLFDDYKGKASAVKNAEMTLERHMHPLDTGGVIAPENLKGKDLVRWRYQLYMRNYLACIASIDDNIGRILDFLKTSGLEENTIVIYTSDQGFFLGDHGWFDKRFMYEESLQMPLIIRYPGVVPKGQVNEDMALNVDFAPTFLDFAGVEIPTDIQGESFRKILQGRTPKNWRQSAYYHYYEYPAWHMVDAHYGIRTKRYKLIHYYGYTDEWEFFDLQDDPQEMNNCYHSPEYQDLIKKLKIELYQLQAYYNVEKPVPMQIEKSETSLF
ncbi:MAG: sulfatase-like hydrolase/transferase [Candidatus Marinimicrobia bacterium]|nr:sulfatase-like hydrolase/transferase [Candidatus Neomarinimicrobiota bacterium]